MSTTTIRIPDELKARVAAVAEQAGVTSHSFILQAIAEKTQQEELRRDFENEAEKRYAKIIATGETVSWKEMRGYLENYAAGNTDAVKPPVKIGALMANVELAPEVRMISNVFSLIWLSMVPRIQGGAFRKSSGDCGIGT